MSAAIPTIDALSGGGEMGALMRSFDWSSTLLGPAAEWPQSLRTAASICLNSRFPMIVWWGPRLVMLYNDSYKAILGDKHPRALGRPGFESWSEIWDVVGPMLEGVVQRGDATWSEDLELIALRRGFLEETYFTFSYSPIRQEDGTIGGAFTAVAETTQRVYGDRQLRTLQELAERALKTRSVGDACRAALDVLDANPRDVALARMYLVEGDGASFRSVTPEREGVDVAGPLREAWRTNRAVEVDLPEKDAPRGAIWPEPVRKALVMPITATATSKPAAVLVIGVSPRRMYDAGYRSFLDLVQQHVGGLVGAADAYEEQRRRAEALAEIDRAKTAFFSNVSHEFRTPLTLQLGPLRDALEDGAHPLDPVQRERVVLAHRNSRRMLDLVNTLLEFSRIEAGRADAWFEPVDLAAATCELASTFRSAAERAGLVLDVRCEPLPEPVHVDRSMWEKIVLNLVSNAYKFTLEGRITVSLRVEGREAVLSVEDTGLGIPDDELPRVFERFRRGENRGARSVEGSGIGLALVRELVRLHGGEIGVASRVGSGTTFTVRLPLGRGHLPADRVVAARPRPRMEAGYELEPAGEGAPALASRPGERPRVLLADDNADMREYAARLLSGEFAVVTAADGEEALAAALADPPHLVITDVMMPRLDGFGLLARLRDDARTRTTPVILLSARAGEEARVEGLAAGADEYLTKPFTARELVGTARAQVALGSLRREVLSAVEGERSRLLSLFQQAPGFLAVLRGPDHVFELTNEPYQQLIGHRSVLGVPVREAIPEVDGQGFFEKLDDVFRTGVAFRASGARVVLSTGPGRPPEPRFLDFVYQPLHEADGRVGGVFVFGFDVTEQREAVDALERSERQYRFLVDVIPEILWTASRDGTADHFSGRWTAYTGRASADTVATGWASSVHPEDVEAVDAAWDDAVRARTPFEAEARLRRRDGVWRWFRLRASPLRDETGDVVKWYGTMADVEDEKLATSRLVHAERMQAVGKLAGGVAHEINNMMTAVIGFGEFVLRGLEPDRQERRDVAEMVKAAHRAAGVSRQLLAYSRQQVLNPVVLDAGAVVRELAPALRRLLGADKRLVLDADPPARATRGRGRPVVRADRGQLEQVLINLVSNARDALPSGGRVVVEVAVEDGDGGRFVRVTVGDDGVGMDAHTMAHVFEPFFTTKPIGLGTGLGLSTAYGIVRQSGGDITVESAPGEGAAFHVRLPHVDDDVAEETPEDALAVRPATVLVVEDEPLVRELAMRCLEDAGYRVHGAATGAEARELLDAEPVDVVVSDVVMPGVSGRALGRYVAERFPSLPMLYISGYPGPEVIARGLILRDAPFLQKPFRPVDLVSRVQQLLDARA